MSKKKVEDDPKFGQRRRTPPWLFHKLQKEVICRKFKLDAAASKENALCKKFYTEQDDGLKQPWRNPTFCNPGFTGFGGWLQKAVQEALERDLVACLIGPKACSQAWFHTWGIRGTIYAPNQRIVFNHPYTGEPTEGAREDSMIFVVGPGFWNPRWKRGEFQYRTLYVKGEVVTA